MKPTYLYVKEHDKTGLLYFGKTTKKDPFKYTDLYFHLKSKLEEILKRQVDLLEERAIKNRIFRQQFENTKVEIYGYKN